MSGIHRSIYELLLPDGATKTAPEFRAHLRHYPRNSLCASLNTMFRRGQLVRTGTHRKYAYALSTDFRARIEAEGLDSVVRERGVRGEFRPRPRPNTSASPGVATQRTCRKYAVYQALYDVPDGLTFSEAKCRCPSDIKPGFIAYALTEAYQRGHATRSALPAGKAFVWSYALTADLRAFIETLGLESAVDEAQHSYLTSPRNKDTMMSTTPQPVWPAFGQTQARPFANSLGSVLPWHDEEEVPPVIGERYRDALRPRPLDD